MIDRSKIEGNQKSLTVIVIGTRWGTLNFQVPRVAVILSVLAVVCLALLSIYAVFKFVDGAGQIASKDALRDLKEARGQLESAQKENARLKERVQYLESQFITVGKKPPGAAAEGESGPTAALPRPFEVTIDQFRIRHHPEDASYHFQLVFKTSGMKRDRASGYVFVLLKSGPEAGPSYPPAELKNGRPQNYRSGDHFAIYRQKTIKGIIKKVPDPNLYQTASVLIFSEEGILLLEKSYDLKAQ